MTETHMPIRVLLIEDNPGDAMLIQDSLTQGGGRAFHLTQTARMEEGKALVSQQAFDVILLDLSLPDSSGLDTVDRAVGAAPRVALIVLTGLADSEIGVEAVRRGAQDYLVKGRSSPEMLVRSIRHAIERKALQQSLQEANGRLEHTVRERTADLTRAVDDLEGEIRERLAAEAELNRVNQVLRMVNACNEAIVRATAEAEMLTEICRIIVDIGGYRLAWVGFAENDEAKRVILAASSGTDDGCLGRASLTWADTEQGQEPTGSAIRTGQIAFGSDFLHGPNLEPWRELALERGFRSSIALPLISAGRTFGALTIYGTQPEAFDGKRIEVLKPLADDLAFGIMALRLREELRRIEREVLDATEREQQRIGRDLHDSIQSSLAGMGFLLDALRDRLAGGNIAPAEAAAADNVGRTARTILSQTRGLVRGLCPLELKGDGLVKALGQMAATTSDLFRVDCKFHCPMPVHVEDETACIHLYRIGQEAVNNALKHSGAKCITVSLERSEEALVLEVRDDGIGLPEGAGERTGLGLQTMNYRAKMIGARFAIGRADGGGTVVRCLWRGTP